MLINYFLFIEILKLIERNERPREENSGYYPKKNSEVTPHVLGTGISFRW